MVVTSSTCDRWNADFFSINFVNVQYLSKFLSKKKWCMGKTTDETKLNWDDLLKHQILVFLLRIKNTDKNLTIFFFSDTICTSIDEKELHRKQYTYEPSHQKTNNLHMRNQRRRSAVQYCTAHQLLCFRNSDSAIPLLLKSKISSF